MPQLRRQHQLPRSRVSAPLLVLLSLPFNIAKGLCTLAWVVAMSVAMRRKARRSSYFPDHKDASAFPADGATTKVQVEATCPICQEPVGHRNPEGMIESWSLLPCGHQFGSYCIKHYLRIVADDRPSCPICRQIAYHSCGHPVLPAPLRPSSADDKKTMEAPAMLVQDMKASTCTFCRENLGAFRGVILRRRPKHNTRLRAAAGWLFTLATRPRRLLGRGRTTEAADRGSSRTSMLLPWQADNDGPWIDPFPRARDPEWESWWDRQPPRGA